MLSVMQAMSQLAPILFNRHYYPQGAAHTSTHCYDSVSAGQLTAIDAMKTSLTLTWFTMVFYHIPLIDARHSEGLSKSRVDSSGRAAASSESNASPAATRQSVRVAGWSEEEEEMAALDVDEMDDLSEDDAKNRPPFASKTGRLAFLDAIFKVLSSADLLRQKGLSRRPHCATAG